MPSRYLPQLPPYCQWLSCCGMPVMVMAGWPVCLFTVCARLAWLSVSLSLWRWNLRVMRGMWPILQRAATNPPPWFPSPRGPCNQDDYHRGGDMNLLRAHCWNNVCCILGTILEQCVLNLGSHYWKNVFYIWNKLLEKCVLFQGTLLEQDMLYPRSIL
jgi:hypothetical protein